MKVIKADVLGYCMGVRRAVEKAEQAVIENTNPETNVYSLGPLIHNNSVLKSLENKGVKILEEKEISQIPENSVVIIRAHGVSPEIYKKLEMHKCRIIDATCPRVQASQKNVRKFSREGYDVILAGDKNHGEVLGIAGFAEGPFILVENKNDSLKIANPSHDKKAVFLSQTTFSPTEFENISGILQIKYQNLKIMNTICPATKERQDALIKLCSQVDAIIVVGGKNSANTKRLLQTALKYSKNAVLIENASEIPENYFSFETVGVTAGASTPDSDIEDVCNRLKRISQ